MTRDLIQDNKNYKYIYSQELSKNQQQKKNENKYLKISGVTKKFNKLNVVNNLNLELFPDEIFCLCGLSGSGKTTLIEMILGLILPEEGDILLNGDSLLSNKNLIKENISVCPQKNFFFDYLTVEENFKNFYLFNGEQPNMNDIQNLINYFNLSNSFNSINCNKLTEEQKRILCLALSLIELKNILILDEPTNGITNENSKKQLWDLIKTNKKDRIILITTNSLEEAEYLESRIGIIKEGNLICTGEINYLKNRLNKEINSLKIMK